MPACIVSMMPCNMAHKTGCVCTLCHLYGMHRPVIEHLSLHAHFVRHPGGSCCPASPHVCCQEAGILAYPRREQVVASAAAAQHRESCFKVELRQREPQSSSSLLEATSDSDGATELSEGGEGGHGSSSSGQEPSEVASDWSSSSSS